MRSGAGALAAMLFWGVASIWVEERWALSLFQVGIFALAGWRLAQPRRIRTNAALAPLAAAALWPFLQAVCKTSVSLEATCDAALNWFTFFLVFALSCDLLTDSGARRWFLGAVSTFGMVLTAAATLQRFSSDGRIFWLFASGFGDDVLGPFVNHNQFAAWIELLFPASLYLALTQARFRPLHGSAAAVMFGGVIASTSRTGFALVLSEAVAVALAATARRPVRGWTLGLRAARFLAVGLIAACVTGWHGLETRLRVWGPEEIRTDAVRASIRMVRERPWTGNGLGTWATVYPRHEGFDPGVLVNQAHNDWAQWAAEGGLPFLFLMAGFAALLWKPAVRSIYGVGTLAFLLHALVDYPMQQRPALAAWFFAMAGAATAWPSGTADDR